MPAAIAEPRLNSIPDTIDRLGVSRTTVYRLIASGELRSVKVRGRHLVSDAAIAEYVAHLEGSGA